MSSGTITRAFACIVMFHVFASAPYRRQFTVHFLAVCAFESPVAAVVCGSQDLGLAGCFKMRLPHVDRRKSWGEGLGLIRQEVWLIETWCWRHQQPWVSRLKRKVRGKLSCAFKAFFLHGKVLPGDNDQFLEVLFCGEKSCWKITHRAYNKQSKSKNKIPPK